MFNCSHQEINGIRLRMNLENNVDVRYFLSHFIDCSNRNPTYVSEALSLTKIIFYLANQLFDREHFYLNN